LKRCNDTEILWKRKHVSPASPELLEILWLIIIIIIIDMVCIPSSTLTILNGSAVMLLLGFVLGLEHSHPARLHVCL